MDDDARDFDLLESLVRLANRHSLHFAFSVQAVNELPKLSVNPVDVLLQRVGDENL